MCRSCATGFAGAGGSAGLAVGAAVAGVDGRAGGRAGALGGVRVCGAAGFGAGFAAVCAAAGDPASATTNERTGQTVLTRVKMEVMNVSFERATPVVAAADHIPCRPYLQRVFV